MSDPLNKSQLKHKYRELYWRYGGLISDAAIGLITKRQAARLLKLRIPEVVRLVKLCDKEARALLERYYRKR